jgi:TonB family protein
MTVNARALEPALACLLLVHAAVILPAQEKKDDRDQPEVVYDLAPGIVPPRIVKQVPPHIETRRGVRIVGSVTIGLIVSSKGFTKEVHVIKGLDKDIDRSAVEAVEQWRFAAGQKDGKPVAVRIAVEIAFHEM